MHSVLKESINYVRKGGKLVIYGVYPDDAKVAWPPIEIWSSEMTVLAAYCEMKMNYLENTETRKVRTQDMVSATYKLEEWAQCLDAVRKQEVVKAAIVLD